MSEAAASTTAESPLLNLAIPHLEHVLEYLSAAELITVESLTCKAFASLIRPPCWSSAIRIGLEALLRAMLYFNNGDNRSAYELMGVKGRERFPKQAKKVDTVLALVLNQAGLGRGNNVAWAVTLKKFEQRPDLKKDYNPIQVVVRRRVKWEGAEDAGMQTRAAFVRWAAAFKCRGCKAYGEARRQCAVCGKLLCLDCSVRCSEDKPRVTEGGRVIDAHCPFALCEKCNEDQSMPSQFKVVPQSWVLEMYIPALCPTSCHDCMFPERRCCPWHANAGVFDCERCKKGYCKGHMEEDWMIYCPACSTCFCHECIPEGLCHRHCESCGYECCSMCHQSDKCHQCGERAIVDGKGSDVDDEDDDDDDEDDEEEEEEGQVEEEEGGR